MVASKNVIELSIKVCLCFSINSMMDSLGIGTPSILTLSLKCIKWGEVYSPTLYPFFCKIFEIIDAVDPLPLVPAK